MIAWERNGKYKFPEAGIKKTQIFQVKEEWNAAE